MFCWIYIPHLSTINIPKYLVTIPTSNTSSNEETFPSSLMSHIKSFVYCRLLLNNILELSPRAWIGDVKLEFNIEIQHCRILIIYFILKILVIFNSISLMKDTNLTEILIHLSLLIINDPKQKKYKYSHPLNYLLILYKENYNVLWWKYKEVYW